MFFNNEALVGWSHLSVHWAIMNVWAAQIGFCASLKKGKKKKKRTQVGRQIWVELEEKWGDTIKTQDMKYSTKYCIKKEST